MKKTGNTFSYHILNICMIGVGQPRMELHNYFHRKTWYIVVVLTKSLNFIPKEKSAPLLLVSADIFIDVNFKHVCMIEL